MNRQIRIAKTVEVENPLSLQEWCEKYKFGSRVQKKNLDIDMYKTGEYDINKLVNLIKHGTDKPVWYLRIFKAFTA